MNLIETYVQNEILVNFDRNLLARLESEYGNVERFIRELHSFNSDLERNKDSYNINPYADKIEQGIYILGKDDSELNIFPNQSLALKCSRGKPCAENLQKQFYRSIQLANYFETKLTSEQRELLNICPVYLYFQTSSSNAFFKQILFMHKIKGGVSLGDTQTGFSQEFCRVFNLPTLEQIKRKHQFALHLYVDKNKQRQLLKIQTVYLFRKLWRKGIKILSLNQRNILVSQDVNSDRYTIIDPIADLSTSPFYNSLTYQFCY
ncbi:MAG: hypothetical protein ACRC2R_15945 [Xenococcaceae cyanobacterium]